MVNIELRKSNFIQKSITKHENKFDYSLVEYINTNTKVKIICPVHGIFLQAPKDHLKGGCRKCADEIRNINNKCDTNGFIKKSKIKHGGKYDYSLVDYIDAKSKVKIICKVHGMFEQKANNHLNGQGCIKCGVENSKKLRSSDTKTFIKKSQKVHGDKYDYSLVEYVNNHTKLKIICKKHGSFMQIPYDHLYNKGCSICNESKGEMRIRNILIKYNINFISQQKFEECKHIKPLPFDFYIPKYNLLVEYQGIQHYKPINRFGGIKKFNDCLRNDNIKRIFCRDNNIKLLEISYTDFKNIEILLKENLNV